MKNNPKEFNLFRSEDNLVNEFEDILSNDKYNDNPLIKSCSKLFKGFKKLLSHTKKIIKVSDNLQSKLQQALKELRLKDLLLKMDLKSAERIQKNLLPDKGPDIQGASYSSVYIPMDEVGGDFFDFLEIDENHTGFFISDVSGHGVSAALITSLIKSNLEMTKKNLLSPSNFINELQRKMLPLIEEKFFTAFYGVFNKNNYNFTYTSAGHLDQLVIRSETKKIEKLFLKGPVIGFFDYPGYDFSQANVKLNSGDILVLFTDGIVELFAGTKSYKTQYKQEGIADSVLRNFNKPAEQIVESIIMDAKQYQGKDKFEDDIALIVLKLP